MDNVVSVIVPMHNTAAYIKTCLLSVLNQTYSNIELIVINDASTDNSNDIAINVLANTQDRVIKYIDLKMNVGVGAARNIGIEHSAGTYISFLDSDDWIDSNYISRMIEALTIQKADIAVCGILNEYGNCLSSSIRYFYNTTYTISGDYAVKLLSRAEHYDYYITPMVGNKIYRKSFLSDRKLSFLANSCYEDDVFNFLAFCSKPKIVLVSDTWQHYRQRENSITHCFSKKKIDSLINSFLFLKKALQDKGLYNEFKLEFESFLDRCVSTTCHSMLQTKATTLEQKQYLLYLLQCLIESFELKSIINYLDNNRIYRLFGVDI